MRPMAPLLTLVMLASLPFAGAGCVQQDRYDELITANRSLQEQIVAVEDERDSAHTDLEAVRNQLAAARGDVSRLQERERQLVREIESMSSENDELLQRISSLDLGPLPVEVESRLNDLAAEYPDVLQFDPDTGLIEFASDFTFDLGSTALRSDAQEAVQRLATIINAPAAQGFQVRVIGHTDNVPIGKPSTRERHPTNMHLSVHRSIAVRDALVTAGVDPVRVGVAGYGPYRPVVENRSGGAAPNRRVEIYLEPMPELAIRSETSQDDSDSSTSSSATTTAREPEMDEPMK